MSKRHTYIESVAPIPDWVLFQENLVFYAPLNNGELFDYISGEVGATSTDAFVQWDANEQMYLLGYDTTLLGHNCTALRYTSQAFKDNTASKHYIYAKDVRVYDRILTDSEVQQLYNAIQ